MKSKSSDLFSKEHWPIIDDVGSFPLPTYTSAENFKRYYWDAFEASIQDLPFEENIGFEVNLIHPIIDGFKRKINAGIEIINYPQLMDMYSQFLRPMELFEIHNEPHLIEHDKAQLLELKILQNWAKLQYEKTQQQIKLKVCVTGPLELYFKKIGFGVYEDMALNFAQSVNSFLQNSIIDKPYLKTEIVAIDEPSLGYVTISGASNDELIKIYDVSTANIPVDVQIHLHSLNSFKIPLQTKNINILTCEYASNSQNVIDKKYLDEYDKFMRVGISRTNFNAIMADALDSGQDYQEFSTLKGLRRLIDSPERILHNLKEADKQYGDRLKYVGPDCGLSAWSPPELAQELLERTVNVVNEFRKKKN